MDDIYAVIQEDHEKARRLIKQLAESEDSEAGLRDELMPVLKSELLVHQHVEEAVFYAHLKNREETRPDALEAVNEHHVVTMLLEELENMPKGNDEWQAKFGVLKELVEHHMEEEEGEFFDNARKVIDADTAAEMGRQMKEKKEAGLAALQPVA